MRRLHHGSTKKIHDIDLNFGRPRTDFGKGFYTGNNLGVARRWAVSQSMVGDTPTVMRYVFDDILFDFNNNSLKRLWFSTPTIEWLDFIRDNRRFISPFIQNTEPRHSYDIVYGPIANDKIADVEDEYIDGIITAEDAVKRAKILPSVFQMSFHTPLALTFIKQELTEYQQLLAGNKWSVWEIISSDFEYKA